MRAPDASRTRCQDWNATAAYGNEAGSGGGNRTAQGSDPVSFQLGHRELCPSWRNSGPLIRGLRVRRLLPVRLSLKVRPLCCAYGPKYQVTHSSRDCFREAPVPVGAVLGAGGA